MARPQSSDVDPRHPREPVDDERAPHGRPARFVLRHHDSPNLLPPRNVDWKQATQVPVPAPKDHLAPFARSEPLRRARGRPSRSQRSPSAGTCPSASGRHVTIGPCRGTGRAPWRRRPNPMPMPTSPQARTRRRDGAGGRVRATATRRSTPPGRPPRFRTRNTHTPAPHLDRPGSRGARGRSATGGSSGVRGVAMPEGGGSAAHSATRSGPGRRRRRWSPARPTSTASPHLPAAARLRASATTAAGDLGTTDRLGRPSWCQPIFR